ncbi:unnamed protein product [Taenia asiatica]|uniref:MICOS complex subunit n=1 Tax=Taenia asiatica TaxID=60517 RepID=A0A0R3WE94_TAEAS|nr:unnamed protein product [Taenia asiatica]
MATDALSEQDQEVLGQTAEDVDSTLSYRDEVLTGGCSADASKEGLNFAPPTLDGATLLFSRYGLRDTPMLRRQAFDHVMWNASKLAVGVGIKSAFLTAGITLALFCLPRGPVPTLVGSVVGLCFGALYGGVYYLGARSCDYTFEQLYARRL